mmetsp:Transcript_69576/g.148832  ORF Transcript_69576/g.148832 Transcript_69576/m.148832 type:complete len:240 (+) Transcript_69576:87-806(+)
MSSSLYQDLLCWSCHKGDKGSMTICQPREAEQVAGYMYEGSSWAARGFVALCSDCSFKAGSCPLYQTLVYKPPSRHSQQYCQRFLQSLHSTPKHKFHDVTIRCGSKDIAANQCILATSPVFEKMLQTQMAEKASRIICIDDFEPDIVEHFVELLYTGEVQARTQWDQLLCIVDKYQTLDLIPHCADQIVSYLTAENIVPVVRALKRAEHHDQCKEAYACVLERVGKERALLEAMAAALC